MHLLVLRSLLFQISLKIHTHSRNFQLCDCISLLHRKQTAIGYFSSALSLYFVMLSEVYKHELKYDLFFWFHTSEQDDSKLYQMG